MKLTEGNSLATISSKTEKRVSVVTLDIVADNRGREVTLLLPFQTAFYPTVQLSLLRVATPSILTRPRNSVVPLFYA
jgi:hypothetical protein